jgi:hypothetical protein
MSSTRPELEASIGVLLGRLIFLRLVLWVNYVSSIQTLCGTRWTFGTDCAVVQLICRLTVFKIVGCVKVYYAT